MHVHWLTDDRVAASIPAISEISLAKERFVIYGRRKREDEKKKNIGNSFQRRHARILQRAN